MNNSRISRTLDFLQKPTHQSFFAVAFMLNLVSNFTSLTFQPGFPYGALICLLSAFIAYMETVLFLSFKSTKVQNIYKYSVIALHSALAVVEYFLLINFHKNINQDIIDILGETNPTETSNFVAAYLQPTTILFYLLVCVAVNVIFSKVSKKVVKFACWSSATALMSFGGCW